MFKILRSQAKIIYWFIAATFILFLFLGGMTSRGCQAPGTASFEAGEIGSVNGMKLSAQKYDFLVRQQVATLRQQSGGRDLNANQYAQARDRAWSLLVQDALVMQAIEDRNITVSDDEILDVFQNNPPAELIAQYRDAEGNLDMNQYYADLQNPALDWSQAEAYVRDLIPRRKLNEQVAATATITEEDVRQEFIRQTGKAVAEYVGVAFNEMDLDVTPTEDEIQAWYRDNIDEYSRGERRGCRVVRFAKAAGEADWEEARTFLVDIREEIVSGDKDFATAAAEYSEDQGNAAAGGDLGTFGREKMVAPFTEAAFALAVGEVSEPVRTQFGYHLIEVLEQDLDAETQEVYQIHARHILLRVSPGPETVNAIRDAADDFRARVDGGSFVSTAEAEAHDLVSPAPVEAGRDIPSLPLTLEAGDWLFNAESGDVSPVFENEQMCYVVLAGEILPADARPLDEVRGRVVLAIENAKRQETARAMLTPAVGEIEMGTDLAVAAANHGLKHAFTDTFTYVGNVAEIGYGTDFNKLVIEGTVDRLIPEIETPRGLYAAVPRWILPIDQAAYEARRPGLQAQLLAVAQGEAITAWLDEQTAAAEIVDLRWRLRSGS